MSSLLRKSNLIKSGIAMMVISIAAVNYVQSNNSIPEVNTTIRSLTKISSANASGESYCISAANEECYYEDINGEGHYITNCMLVEL